MYKDLLQERILGRMHSFLIVGKGNIDGEIEKLTKKLEAKILPFELKKMADIKNLSDFTKLKLSENTAIVIDGIDKASEEAQNAFLKSLEEPQKNLSYILTATNITGCLPTIVSRCMVIEVKDNKIPDSNFVVSAMDFINLPLGKKMETISEIKTREEAVDFLTSLIYSGHSFLIKGESVNNFLENANKTLGALKANGNVQLQLTNFIVNI